ncbi:alkaline phosphatase D family protein [Sphingomonas sp.]|uniref:alkaline phosphatase D family protein n=1 Tax=Sphingomonas sp. TaxID=28214 RepID=UPI002DBD07B8|nr:alkaline phosphatase D family protein [Sphingomonas sp.]HEU4968949.1 alkaline phosphatase D family protein [Sphingomonas sp.]
MSDSFPKIDRRTALAGAAAMGATLLWPGAALAARTGARERRDLFPEGVASGDPEPDSVILWTRRPYPGGMRRQLTVELAADPDFKQIVGARRAPILAEADWTCRVLAAGLKPRTVYWYRFIDAEGNASRVGRTITAPRADDTAPVRFAFVSCQSVNEGWQHAYRRMIHEDEQAAPERQLGFVLHLGDFIYEVVEYPDEIAHRYDRTIKDIGRVPNARKVLNFHVPTELDGYRTVYRAHIADPDIQDARARFPFVCIGDNHEFSWKGWQSYIQYDGPPEPAQPLKVAANQAWWEYIPSRVAKASGPGLDRFDGPKVEKAPIERVDDHGLGDEPNNRAALGSMTAYRALRYGQHVDLIITDMHSYMMADPTGRPEAEPLGSPDFPLCFPEEALRALDAGRALPGGPPDTIAFGEATIPNFRKEEPPFTLLGRVQKAWFKERLAASRATWKIWAASNGTLDWRLDPQNLPAGLGKPWPGRGYACSGGGDLSGAYTERAELYDFVRDRGIDGFVTVSGDRHSFWAGYAAKALPPARFEPVGIAFITGSISSAGLQEALEHGLKDHPLRPVFIVQRPGEAKPEGTLNLALHHGVRSALEYARTGDIERARALSNPDMAPHLAFIDMGGHGYSVVTASTDRIDTEFVCIPRPVAQVASTDGGPVRYRIVHSAAKWRAGEAPRLDQRIIEGDPKLSI